MGFSFYLGNFFLYFSGDKYINGTIIPRPPPVQYGRQTGRYRDRNRYPDQPRYDRPGPMANQQGNASYANQQGNPSYNQGPTQGGRNYGNPQNYPSQQSYGPPGQGERRDPVPMNAPRGRDPRDPYQPGRGPMPSYQGNYNQGGPGNFHPQEQRNYPQADQSSYAPSGQGGYRGDNRNYGPTQGTNYGQGGVGYQGQGSPEAYGQGEQRNVQGEQRNYPPMGQTGYDQVRPFEFY